MSGPSGPLVVRTLLQQALELYRDNPRAAGWLHRHLTRFDEPLRLAVLGAAGTGKSTLVNALAGERVAPQQAADGSMTSWYRADHDLIVIDTPAPDEQSIQASCTDADAVLHLAPNPYRGNSTALRAAHDHPIAASTPVGSLTVVSRADELGSGRIDALIAARQVARRYRNESEIRDLSQDAVAVCGLVAAAAATLTEDEFAALRTLANTAREDLEAQLLSADRFTRADSPLPLARAARQALLERFGVFGLRLASTLIRQGADSVPTLAAQLTQRSGLGELRDSIRRYFIDRADVLKARAALIGLDVLLRREPHPSAAGLLGEVDRVLAGAHDYQELRLLGDLCTARVDLPDELATEAARLIGAEGTHPVRRLGLDAAYLPADPRYQQALFGALWRWREHAENPAFSAAQNGAARTVVRSCEAMATTVLADAHRSDNV